MTRSFSILSWAPALTVLAILAWAVRIWWMVTMLPGYRPRAHREAPGEQSDVPIAL